MTRAGKIPNFPVKLENELKHCILAHHGELEYGSPKKPALLEAVALNFADNTDAHMETMIEILAGAGEESGMAGIITGLFESNIVKQVNRVQDLPQVNTIARGRFSMRMLEDEKGRFD